MSELPSNASESSFLIVIVLYNSADWIAKCLDAIRRVEFTNYEVMVVDNASADNGAEIVEKNYPWVQLVRSEINRGFAGGNNFGVAQAAKTDFVFLLNPDTEIDRDGLSFLAKAFQEHPKLGVAGCKMYESDGVTIQHVGGMIRANGLTYHLGNGEQERGQYQGLIPCDYAQGAGMAVRRRIWDEMGGFDESFNPAYFEEADLCVRAGKAGWEVATVCESKLIHHQDTAAQVRSRKFLELLFRGRAKFLFKHYSIWQWLTRYLPAELAWLMSGNSKGFRKIALSALWSVRRGRTKKIAT